MGRIFRRFAHRWTRHSLLAAHEDGTLESATAIIINSKIYVSRTYFEDMSLSQLH